MDVDALDRVLKDRGVEISRSKLSAALQDPAFSSWAKLHLTPATLLTPDELARYVICLPCILFPPRPPFLTHRTSYPLRPLAYYLSLSRLPHLAPDNGPSQPKAKETLT